MTEAEKQEYDMLAWRVVADTPMTEQECQRYLQLKVKYLKEHDNEHD